MNRGDANFLIVKVDLRYDERIVGQLVCKLMHGRSRQRKLTEHSDAETVPTRYACLVRVIDIQCVKRQMPFAAVLGNYQYIWIVFLEFDQTLFENRCWSPRR